MSERKPKLDLDELKKAATGYMPSDKAWREIFNRPTVLALLDAARAEGSASPAERVQAAAWVDASWGDQ